MSISIRNLITANTLDYSELNKIVRAYNPLIETEYPACKVIKGIAFPFINNIGFGSKLPTHFVNDIKHQIKKDGSERVEITSHLLITDKDETLFYHLNSRKRLYHGNKAVGTQGMGKYSVPSNVHTVIQLINVFVRNGVDDLTDEFYISKDMSVTIFSRDPRFNDVK